MKENSHQGGNNIKMGTLQKWVPSWELPGLCTCSQSLRGDGWGECWVFAHYLHTCSSLPTSPCCMITKWEDVHRGSGMAEMSVSTPLKLAEPSVGARHYSGHWDIARNTNKSLLWAHIQFPCSVNDRQNRYIEANQGLIWFYFPFSFQKV